MLYRVRSHTDIISSYHLPDFLSWWAGNNIKQVPSKNVIWSCWSGIIINKMCHCMYQSYYLASIYSQLNHEFHKSHHWDWPMAFLTRNFSSIIKLGFSTYWQRSSQNEQKFNTMRVWTFNLLFHQKNFPPSDILCCYW